MILKTKRERKVAKRSALLTFALFSFIVIFLGNIDSFLSIMSMFNINLLKLASEWHIGSFTIPIVNIFISTLYFMYFLVVLIVFGIVFLYVDYTYKEES